MTPWRARATVFRFSSFPRSSGLRAYEVCRYDIEWHLHVSLQDLRRWAAMCHKIGEVGQKETIGEASGEVLEGASGALRAVLGGLGRVLGGSSGKSWRGLVRKTKIRQRKISIRCDLEASRSHLGAILEPSWCRLAALLGPSWALLGAMWATLGRFGHSQSEHIEMGKIVVFV